ncbi:MAG: thiamine phosphate synthase [Paracoccaceae bacterium]
MPDLERPQIYLITPPELELSSFTNVLSSVLDANTVACIRLALSSEDETHIQRTADGLRDICHARDIPLVIQTHFNLVEKLGLDGVHLTDGSKNVRQVRKDLGSDAIIGAHCAISRHDGMNAAEAGVDYVSFGPVGHTALGDGKTAPLDLFQWWSEVIEVPIVAEGGLDEKTIASLSEITDFAAIGSEIWSADDPAKRLQELAKILA